MRSITCVLLFSAALAVGAAQSSPQSGSPSSSTWSINGGLWRTDAGFSSCDEPI